ncbi:hypothetical protein EBZ80_05030 [bacterium]|nr:hypothetical protein [bacterium]
MSEERPCDAAYRDVLIDEDDPEIRLVLEESRRLYRLQVEQEQERRREEARVEALRARLGIVTARLRQGHAGDPIAQDLIRWIEWELTPTHELKTLRPETSHPLQQIHEWMEKNLNPSLREKIAGLGIF